MGRKNRWLAKQIDTQPMFAVTVSIIIADVVVVVVVVSGMATRNAKAQKPEKLSKG